MSGSPAYAGVGETSNPADLLDRLTQAERLLTAKELATLLAISPKTLYSYVERNLIPHFKIETNVRFRGCEVADWLRRRGMGGGDQFRAPELRDGSHVRARIHPVRSPQCQACISTMNVGNTNARAASRSTKKKESARACPVPTGRITGQYAAGRAVIGIREVSRNLEFSSSYTLVEHAPAKSIETEIKPVALEAVEKLKAAVRDNDFSELFRVLGMTEDLEVVRHSEALPDLEHTSAEHTIVEAILKSDPNGLLGAASFRQLPFAAGDGEVDL
jgi:excisionase family DNA binding protein